MAAESWHPPLLGPTPPTTGDVLQQVNEVRTEWTKKASALNFLLTAAFRRLSELEEQVSALKQQVSDLSKPPAERPDKPPEPREPTPRVPRYSPSSSKPYRYASDIEYMMRETPRAISEWEKPYDPYRDRD